MQTTILLAVTVEHDGAATPAELAASVAVWVEATAHDQGELCIETDEGGEAYASIEACTGSVDVG